MQTSKYKKNNPTNIKKNEDTAKIIIVYPFVMSPCFLIACTTHEIPVTKKPIPKKTIPKHSNEKFLCSIAITPSL